jgi:CheY-like chemotaxis protein
MGAWRVLCVDDDAGKAAEVAEYFSEWKRDNPYGEFDVSTETSFEDSLERLSNERFDLVTLDLHGTRDPDPRDAAADADEQEGKRVLDALKTRRFVPVIFYTGFAEKIASLRSPVVHVVKKGRDDVEGVRDAARSIYTTGLPRLVRHVEDEQRKFVWETVDQHWNELERDSCVEELSYLLARRLAAQLSRESMATLLGRSMDKALPIQLYIYPPIPNDDKTGNVYGPDAAGIIWVVATPLCEFAQKRVERALLVGGKLLSVEKRHVDWSATRRWRGEGRPPDEQSEKAYSKLLNLIKNRGGDRYWFLPGTFFIPPTVLDMQLVMQVELAELEAMRPICRLDSPYREEFTHHFSAYYGRLGIPDIDSSFVFGRM